MPCSSTISGPTIRSVDNKAVNANVNLPRKRCAAEIDVEVADRRPTKRLANSLARIEPKKRVHFPRLKRNMLCAVPRVAYNNRTFPNGEVSGSRLRSILRLPLQKAHSRAKPERVPVQVTSKENRKEVPTESPEVAFRRKFLAIVATDEINGADLRVATFWAQYRAQAREARTSQDAENQLLAEFAEHQDRLQQERTCFALHWC